MKKFLILLFTLLFSMTIFMSACTKVEAQGIGEPSNEPASFETTSTVLVDNLRSDYKIVIPEISSKMEDFAAQELQYFLYESTGCELEIIRDTGLVVDNANKYLSIGNTTLLLAQTDIVLDDEVMGDTTPSIDTIGNSVYMAGVDEYGILNSVYKFLEYQIGFKAYAYDCVVYDYYSKLYLLNFDYHYVPTIEYLSLNEAQFRDNELNAAAARMHFFNHDNGGSGMFEGSLYNMLWCHTIDLVVPESSYPQFWNNAQYCMSDPDALEVFSQSLAMKYAMGATGPFLMIGGNDNESICGCGKCTETIAKYGSGGLMSIFINNVADYLENFFIENNIDKELCLVGLYYLAYDDIPAVANGDGTYSAVDPIVIPDNEGNVTAGICYAPMLACYAHPFGDDCCEKNETYTECYRKAAAITENLFTYIYGYHFSGQYYHSYFFNNFSTYQANYEFFDELGVRYLNEESNRWSLHQMTELFTYARSSFGWNRDTTIESIVNEFSDAYYGIAADCMKDYYNAVIEHYQSIYVKTNNLHEGIYDASINSRTYPHQVYLNFASILESAMNLIESSTLTPEKKTLYYERIQREWYIVKCLEYDMYKDSLESNYLTELEKTVAEANEKYPIFVLRGSI